MKRLDLVIIPMQFPVHSETFISARLRTLVQSGHRLRVFALRGSAPGDRQLAKERAVDTIPTSHNGPLTSLKGVVEALRRPVLLADTLTWLINATRGNLPQKVRAFAVLPRAFDILAQLERDPPDVLHSEWGHYPTIVARLVQQRLPRTVVSVSLIAYDLTTEFGGTIDVVRDAEVIRTQTLANVAHIARFSGVAEERVAVVHDGVEFARIRRIVGRSPKVAGRCVVAGRLIPEKGMDDAIRVFANVRGRVPGASLRVLGSGPDLARLQGLAADLGVSQSVDFLGHVSHEKVIEEFAVAEVLMHMSHSERLPNVVKEGMACHCACVTTRTVGIEELVDDGVTGYIIGNADVAAATAIVEKLLVGELPMAEVGEAAYRFVAANFDHDKSVARLALLWSSALEQQREKPTAPTI